MALARFFGGMWLLLLALGCDGTFTGAGPELLVPVEPNHNVDDTGDADPPDEDTGDAPQVTLTEVVITPESVTLDIGDEKHLMALGTYSDGSSEDLANACI